MANMSSLCIYHPLDDFKKEDQEYFIQYREAEKQAEKYWVKDKVMKGSRVWKGLKKYHDYIADLLQLPPLDPTDKNGRSRIKKYAHFAESPDGELLVYPYGVDQLALGHIYIDFLKEGRNTVPDYWRIACMTAQVDAGCNNLTEIDMFCYASNRLALPDAIHNTSRYLNAAYRLPVSQSFGIWIPFARFCGHLEDFGEWLALHSLLSFHPERCLVVLDWGEVAFFYADDAEIKKDAKNDEIIENVKKLEQVKTIEEGLGVLLDDPKKIDSREADLFSWARLSYPFEKFRSTESQCVPLGKGINKEKEGI